VKNLKGIFIPLAIVLIFSWSQLSWAQQSTKTFRWHKGNTHTHTLNSDGGGGLPSVEEIWDDVLSSGKLIYGVAVDDAHIFKEPWNKNAARPGQGWIIVQAERLTAEALLEAMEKGDFYSSTGVELDEFLANEETLSITIRERGAAKFRTQFIGRGGKVCKEDTSNPASYKFKGDEMYIRAKILDSNGRVAWTQPVMIKNRD